MGQCRKRTEYCTFIMKWKDFLQTPYAEQHVPCCLSKLNDAELLAESEENSDIGDQSQETGLNCTIQLQS